MKKPSEYQFQEKSIPDYMWDPLEDYLVNHIAPESRDFLEAVLCNDLREACQRADDTNINLLPVYVAYLYWEAPSEAWGSKAKFEAWIAAEPPK